MRTTCGPEGLGQLLSGTNCMRSLAMLRQYDKMPRRPAKTFQIGSLLCISHARVHRQKRRKEYLLGLHILSVEGTPPLKQYCDINQYICLHNTVTRKSALLQAFATDFFTGHSRPPVEPFLIVPSGTGWLKAVSGCRPHSFLPKMGVFSSVKVSRLCLLQSSSWMQSIKITLKHFWEVI